MPLTSERRGMVITVGGVSVACRATAPYGTKTVFPALRESGKRFSQFLHNSLFFRTKIIIKQ